jgi:hypothetical protein
MWGDYLAWRETPRKKALRDFDPTKIRTNAQSDMIWALFSHAILGAVVGIMFLTIAALDYIARPNQ